MIANGMARLGVLIAKGKSWLSLGLGHRSSHGKEGREEGFLPLWPVESLGEPRQHRPYPAKYKYSAVRSTESGPNYLLSCNGN